MANSITSQSQAPVTPDRIISFLLDRSPDALLKAVFACAADGDPRWHLIVGADFAQQTADSPTLQWRFFNGLIGEKPTMFGAPIIDAYLRALMPHQIQALFDPGNVKRKGHPIRQALRASSFKTETGLIACGVLEAFIRHGLKGDLLIETLNRAQDDFARACRQCNWDFLNLVMPNVPKISDRLLVEVIKHDTDAHDAVMLLVEGFDVSIERFAAPKVLAHATSQTRNFIVAMEARLIRDHRTRLVCPLPHTAYVRTAHEIGLPESRHSPAAPSAAELSADSGRPFKTGPGHHAAVRFACSIAVVQCAGSRSAISRSSRRAGG